MNSLSRFDTIAAIATPPGNAGVGIIRISGDNALSFANKKLKPRYATMVDILGHPSIAIYFKSPHSFTGEDIIELQVHGGSLFMDKVLSHVIANGARMAKPGEFTRRALMNGKITLAGAESLIDIIHAESDQELLIKGEIHTKMLGIETELLKISAELEAAIDHEIEFTPNNNQIKKFIKTISEFTDNVRQTNYVYNGIRAVILGEPNAGKSSLFNALVGSDRAIVTDIAGTTTDCVSETIQINGYKVRLVDTAGIRNATGKIERLGIKRTTCAARDCDIALVFDKTALELVKDKPHIFVTRKTDIEQIKQQIIHMTVGLSQNRQIANARQLNELNLAKQALEAALTGSCPESSDILASCVQTALYHLGNITGTNVSEAVLNEIFSRFCIGK